MEADGTRGTTGPSGNPDPSDPLEGVQGQGGDSFLAAARLLRRGWRDGGRRTFWRFSQSGPPGEQEEAAAAVEPPAEDVQANAVLANTPKETDGGRRVVVRVWASGCSATCRRARRLKAPILPAIAEI